MPKILIYVWLIALFLLGMSSVAALADDGLAARDWKVEAPQSLEKYPPATSDLKNFVNKTLASDWDMEICSYAFIDVARDGAYRLIASLDANGRHTCNRLVVIEKTGGHANVVNNLHVAMVEDVHAALRDLDGGRVPELVVPEIWSRYESGHCLAVWQRVYKWQSGRFVDRSAAFPDFYKTRREELSARMAQDTDPTCDEMETDKIDRLLGAPTTGFDRAEAWMKNPDPSLRRKAATVFSDIGDKISKKNLALLAKDGDPLTAESARLYLEASQPD